MSATLHARDLVKRYGAFEAVHDVEGTAGGIAGTVAAVTIFVFAGMAYFVRQRDRLQRESDDLLHNILPDEIATRLKSDDTLIADDYESASVLFADMVGFTPMSAAMTPPQLIKLLNDVFAAFDGFVEDLGLEKIRTVGDEYMVAAGVPQARPYAKIICAATPYLPRPGRCSSVAEQLFRKQQVAGSIPITGSSFSRLTRTTSR